MERIVSASPTLNAAYLQRLDQMQADIARIVTRERQMRADHAPTPTPHPKLSSGLPLPA